MRPLWIMELFRWMLKLYRWTMEVYVLLMRPTKNLPK